MANVANFVLFALALCERCRICVNRCIFPEFSGWTPSLRLWCGFSEFRVIRGGCRQTARNLVDSLQFPGFSVDGHRSETRQLNIDQFYCKMCGICVIHGIGGRIERISLDSLEFLGNSLPLVRQLKHSKWCEFRVIRGLCGRITQNFA